MTRTSSRLASCGLVCAVLLVPEHVAAQESLSRAKDYYTSASYDEALRVLQKLRAESPSVSTEITAYEMFCWLALGREQQARSAVEDIVRQDPLYRPPANDVSPRVRTFFEDVRRPLLPSVIRELYSTSRSQLDQHDYAAASLGFDRVVTLIDEYGPAVDPGLSDLRLLAVGFGDLARVSPDAHPPDGGSPAATGPGPSTSSVGAPAASPATAGAADSAVRTQPADYGPDDGDVTPPVTISRSLPAWQPINPVDRIRSFRGKLELLVDETGRVSTITVIQGVHVDYDRALLRAVGDWRYKPALRNGVPVRYRLPVDIVLTAKQ